MTKTLAKEERGFLRLIFVMMTTSSIVLMEPAPYDLLMVVLCFIAFFYGLVEFNKDHFFPAMLLIIYTLTNLISLYFARDFAQAFSYFLITVYLAVSWFLFSGVSSRLHVNLYRYIFSAYLAAAVITVMSGIAAYVQLIPGLDFLLMQGRVQGFFKDPNVFGPFLVPPALYTLLQLGRRRTRRKMRIVWLCLFVLLSTGVLLSYSRAAWGQLVLAIGVFFLLINNGTHKRVQTLFLLLIAAAPILIYFVTSTAVGELFFGRFGLQDYDQTRFQNQENALDNIFRFPLGFGPGQSEIVLDIAAHSLYIRLIAENGIFGALSFIGFLVVCLSRSLQLVIKAPPDIQGYFVIIAASLIGIIFNSIFIDTIHWRHMWLLLAMPWVRLSTIKSKK
ncbi:O-antigen ligase family protein [Lentibacillus salinarum]|uniref:O-antigen ligase family protein n=1 Tax=Lentibacillus salinarum TaxID=446820 RepID=A0ABW3ZQP7_9BACI